MQRETLFKRRVKDDLKALGWHVKTQQVSVRGIPDIIACIRGKFVALELKKDDQAEATALQLYNVNLIRKAGGFAQVVAPSEWPQVLDRIKALDKG